MYEGLTQPGFKPYKESYNFLGQLDKKGRIKFDESGNIIPRKFRIASEDFAKNPYGVYTAGNAINPMAPAAPNFLSSYGGGVANAANPITAILGGGFR